MSLPAPVSRNSWHPTNGSHLSRRLREGKARFSSTEGDDDDELPDLSNILGTSGTKGGAVPSGPRRAAARSSMSRAVTHPFKPKIEPKEEMDVDDENDREDQKENIDLDVKANNVGGGLPGAFPALPAPLPGFAAAPAAGGFRADPLFQPGLFARPAPAVQAAGDVPIIDYHAQLQALRARQAAVAAAAAAARTADIVPKAGPSNRPAGADPEQTLRNADDDPGSSDDEEHRTRVEEILAGGGGPVEQKSVWCAWRIEIGPCTDTDTFQPIGCVLPGQCWRTRLQRRWHGSYGDRPKLSWAQRTQRSAAKVCLSFFRRAT